MSKAYLIISKTNNHYSILDSLSSSQGIGSDLIYRQNDKQLVCRVKHASDVLHMHHTSLLAAVIIRRLRLNVINFTMHLQLTITLVLLMIS